MTIHLDFDSSIGILKAKITGRPGPNDYRLAMQQITRGENYPTTVSTIWDLREFDFEYFDAHLAEVARGIRAAFKSRENAMIAYVVPSPLGYGMMRMFQVLTGTSDESLVCYDYGEAMEWIMKRNHMVVEFDHIKS